MKCKRYNINIQEILTMSHKISAPFISKTISLNNIKPPNNGITMQNILQNFKSRV